MVVLIVASNPDLSRLWANHIRRLGCVVGEVHSQADAVCFLQDRTVDVIVLDLLLEEGSAVAVADFASYRRPDARVVFVTNSSFFSDGSIFNHIPNTAALVRDGTPPQDIAAIVEYHGRAGSTSH